MRKNANTFVATLFVFGILAVLTFAQDAAKPLPPSGDQAATAAEEKSANDETNEILKVPTEGTANDLEEYTKKMLQYRPKNTKSQEDVVIFIEKRMQALVTVADLMLKKQDATEVQKEIAREMKLATIIFSAKKDVTKAIAELEKYREELIAVKSEVQYKAQALILQGKLEMALASEQPIEGFKKELADMKTILEKDPVQKTAMMAMMFMQAAGSIDQDGKEGLEELVVSECKPVLEKIDSPQVKDMLLYMEGTIRFKKMEKGSELELECILLDGKKINLKDLKGKVVLIDVWATWCPPCLAEMPNLKEQYDKYHDKGFEVIGYSVDEELEVLQKFEEETPHPWHVASSVMTLEKGLPDFATYYGIPGYPTMILVGKDGKVISKDARGLELNRLLEEIFQDGKKPDSHENIESNGKK